MKSIDDLPDGRYSARFTWSYQVQNLLSRFNHNPSHLIGEQVFEKCGCVWWWRFRYGMAAMVIDEKTVRKMQ